MARVFVFILALSAALLAGGCGSRGNNPLEESAPPRSEEELSQAQAESGNASLEGAEAPAEEAKAPETEILTLTVPEGYTLPRIAMVLEEMDVCTVESFIEAAQTGEFGDFPLVAAQAEDERRCFRLEGYLFPDTYQIYSTDTPDAIIRRMLDHTERKFTAELRQQVEASGFTADEILILASIIEKEAFGHGQMPLISSVLHNRLEQGMRLQCDVTITYVEGAIKPFITGDINRYNEYYNTYKCDALPSGAICNPGMDAIQAALAPAESDYLYFVTDKGQNYYYAETWEEHERNVANAGIGVDPDDIEPD